MQLILSLIKGSSVSTAPFSIESGIWRSELKTNTQLEIPVLRDLAIPDVENLFVGIIVEKLCIEDIEILN